MEQMYQGLLQGKDMPSDDLTLETVKHKQEPHGRLTGCSYYAFSNGMMYNSNTVLNISLMQQNGVQQISHTEKAAFQPTITTVYRLNCDALAAVQALAEEVNLAAWSALEYRNMFQCTDYSSSAKITLYFDERCIGGSPCVSVSIDVDAAFQHGGGDAVKRFRDLLEDAVKGAEVISTQKTGQAMGMGMMGVPLSTPAPSGTWNCSCCGKEGNTGKFCPECGSGRDTA